MSFWKKLFGVTESRRASVFASKSTQPSAISEIERVVETTHVVSKMAQPTTKPTRPTHLFERDTKQAVELGVEGLAPNQRAERAIACGDWAIVTSTGEAAYGPLLAASASRELLSDSPFYNDKRGDQLRVNKRLQILNALETIIPKVTLDLLASNMDHKNDDVRKLIAEGLASHRDPRTIEVLTTTLHRGAYQARITAAMALKRLGTAETARTIANLLSLPIGENTAKVLALGVLATIGTTNEVTNVLTCVQDPDGNVREAAISAMKAMVARRIPGCAEKLRSILADLSAFDQVESGEIFLQVGVPLTKTEAETILCRLFSISIYSLRLDCKKLKIPRLLKTAELPRDFALQVDQVLYFDVSAFDRAATTDPLDRGDRALREICNYDGPVINAVLLLVEKMPDDTFGYNEHPIHYGNRRRIAAGELQRRGRD